MSPPCPHQCLHHYSHLLPTPVTVLYASLAVNLVIAMALAAVRKCPLHPSLPPSALPTTHPCESSLPCCTESTHFGIQSRRQPPAAGGRGPGRTGGGGSKRRYPTGRTWGEPLKERGCQNPVDPDCKREREGKGFWGERASEGLSLEV